MAWLTPYAREMVDMIQEEGEPQPEVDYSEFLAQGGALPHEDFSYKPPTKKSRRRSWLRKLTDSLFGRKTPAIKDLMKLSPAEHAWSKGSEFFEKRGTKGAVEDYMKWHEETWKEQNPYAHEAPTWDDERKMWIEQQYGNPFANRTQPGGPYPDMGSYDKMAQSMAGEDILGGAIGRQRKDYGHHKSSFRGAIAKHTQSITGRRLHSGDLNMINRRRRVQPRQMGGPSRLSHRNTQPNRGTYGIGQGINR